MLVENTVPVSMSAPCTSPPWSTCAMRRAKGWEFFAAKFKWGKIALEDSDRPRLISFP